MERMGGMKKISLLLIEVLLLCVTAKAQNLVLNAGFEESFGCPTRGFQEIHLCKGWTDPAGSADYFNTCMPSTSESDKGKTITSYIGSQNPHSGDGFAGFFLFDERNFYDREYLQIQLKKLMQKDSLYIISFYLCIAKNSIIFSDHISICLSQSRTLDLINTNPNYPNPLEPRDKHGLTFSCRQRVQLNNIPALKSQEWALVQFNYRALGGEEYLTIGSFSDDMSKRQFRRAVVKNVNCVRQGSKAAYYYIDDVSVVPASYRPDFSHDLREIDH